MLANANIIINFNECLSTDDKRKTFTEHNLKFRDSNSKTRNLAYRFPIM